MYGTWADSFCGLIDVYLHRICSFPPLHLQFETVSEPLGLGVIEQAVVSRQNDVLPQTQVSVETEREVREKGCVSASLGA